MPQKYCVTYRQTTDRQTTDGRATANSVSSRSLKIHFFFVVFGKTMPYGKIFKIVFRKDSSPQRSTCCVQTSRNLAYGKSVKSYVAYLTNKISLGSVAFAAARIAPKICQGQPQILYSDCSRFHQNWCTFGGVISERVNTARAR